MIMFGTGSWVDMTNGILIPKAALLSIPIHFMEYGIRTQVRHLRQRQDGACCNAKLSVLFR